MQLTPTLCRRARAAGLRACGGWMGRTPLACALPEGKCPFGRRFLLTSRGRSLQEPGDGAGQENEGHRSKPGDKHCKPNRE